MRPLSLLLSLALSSSPIFALDDSKLAEIHPAMEAAVKLQQAAGIVTLVMEKGKVIHHDSVGMADLALNKPMPKDAIFWIASMTKSVNAAAVMLLVDEGKLTLDEPASKWLPDLAKVTVATALPVPGSPAAEGAKPERPITLRMLLSHTAGIAFPTRKPSDGAISLKSYVASLIKTPLAFQPGTNYEYGFGPTIAGRIIEVVSGMRYEDFLHTRLFVPLGMTDTTFHPNEAQRARIARTYKMDEDTHQLVPGYNPFVTSDVTVTHMPEPAGGLFSTATDMGRFYSMIAGQGELNGKRILAAKSVQDMTTPVSVTPEGGPARQLNYASGWQCNIENQRVCSAMPVGSFGHGGAFATNGWVDPQSGIVTVYLVQNVLVPDSGKPKDTFQRLVMESASITVKPVPPVKKPAK